MLLMAMPRSLPSLMKGRQAEFVEQMELQAGEIAEDKTEKIGDDDAHKEGGR